jgi:alkylated DNA repair dioxygenase AlkB
MVPGLQLIKDFVSEEDEAALIAAIDGTVWHTSLRNRRVQHHGYAFDYSTRCCHESQPLGPFPPFVEAIAQRLRPFTGPSNQLLKEEKGRESNEGNDERCEPDQMTVNEYHPGDGIAAHVDTTWAFTDGLCSLSLGSDIVMEFKLARDPAQSKQLLLPARSLLVMRGAARYSWTHCIHPRKADVYKLLPDDRSAVRHSAKESDLAATTCDSVFNVGRGRRLSMTFRKILPTQARLHDAVETAPNTSAVVTSSSPTAVTSSADQGVEAHATHKSSA